jgi:hypothetical protein
MSTTDKKMILMPTPVAWAFKITGATTEPVAAAAIVETYLFDNLAKGGKVIDYNPKGSEASGEFKDFIRNDGAIVRFPKFNLVLDGKDESDITPSDQASDATKKGRIELITNEAPLPNSINSMSAFIAMNKAEIKADTLWLIVVGVGYSWQSGFVETTPKVDGWVYMLGKMVNDIEIAQDDNFTQKMDFDSYKCTLNDVDAALLEAATFTPITWKGKNKTFQPVALTTADCTALLEGEVLLKPGITYSYS